MRVEFIFVFIFIVEIESFILIEVVVLIFIVFVLKFFINEENIFSVIFGWSKFFLF